MPTAPPSATLEVHPPALTPRVRQLIVLGVALSTAATLIGTAFSPVLAVRSPLLLVALCADMRHLILAAPQVDAAWLIPVGALRRAAGMSTTYGFGALWGFVAVRWAGRRSPLAARVLDWVERTFQRVGLPLLFVVPSYTLCLLSGAARLSFRGFLLTVLPGQVVWTALTVYAGDQLSGWTALVLAFLERHLLASTAVCVAAVLAQQLWSRRQKVRAARGEA